MPYGMSKSIGGDTAPVDAKMERCVRDLMAKHYTKESAIKICKVSITKSQKGKSGG